MFFRKELVRVQGSYQVYYTLHPTTNNRYQILDTESFPDVDTYDNIIDDDTSVCDVSDLIEDIGEFSLARLYSNYMMSCTHHPICNTQLVLHQFLVCRTLRS